MLNGGDMNKIMEQAKEMQEKLKGIQDEFAEMVTCGESGAGLVKVEINGKYETNSVTMSDELMTEEKSVVEDLVAAAFNDAVHKMENDKKGRMGKIAASFGLPPDMKMPF